MRDGSAVVRSAAQRSRVAARWWRGARDQVPAVKAVWAAATVSATSAGEAEWAWAKMVPVEGSSMGMLKGRFSVYTYVVDSSGLGGSLTAHRVRAGICLLPIAGLRRKCWP